MVVGMDIELRDLTDTERGEQARNVQDRAQALAEQLGAPEDLTRYGRDGCLARLHGLALLREALDRAVTTEVRLAADAGADYQDLGDAWGISRQAARKRWPGELVQRKRWFGSLLSWERTADGYRTRYAGREYDIVKLERRDADMWGGGVRPGWHFTSHPDSHPDDLEHAGFIGPGLGRTLLTAKKLAEAWLTTAASDRQPADGAPNVLLALGGSGAAFADGLAAYPDDEQRRITVHRHRQEQEIIGVVGTHFNVPDRTDLEPVQVRWLPALATGEVLPAASTWHEAARALAAVIT